MLFSFLGTVSWVSGSGVNVNQMGQVALDARVDSHFFEMIVGLLSVSG